jgi:hypothetical protein
MFHLQQLRQQQCFFTADVPLQYEIYSITARYLQYSADRLAEAAGKPNLTP